MKSILLFSAVLFLAIQLPAQSIKPGVKTTFHAVDKDGKPLGGQNIQVEITFAKKDANGNKVPIYSEKFLRSTTRDGYFQWTVGAEFGIQPQERFGEYKDVDFKDPDLCVRVDFRPEGFNQPWITGDWSAINPVPLAAVSVDATDENDKDQDSENEIQEITKDGEQVTLSKNGGSIALNDDDPTNELQVLSYDSESKTLHLENGNTVDLSSLSAWDSENENSVCVNKQLQATQFTTKDGRTDIEGGKISLRTASGSDGIEMGVDEMGYPFMTFIDPMGEILAEIRMGPDGFCLYKN